MKIKKILNLFLVMVMLIGVSTLPVDAEMVSGQIYMKLVQKGKKLNHQGYGDYYYNKKKHKNVMIKPSSNEKGYVKDYFGQNLANVGYYSLGGDRLDEYGNQTVKLILCDVDGKHIDEENEKELSKYVVIGQDQKPNTEIVFRYQLGDDGIANPNDDFIESQSIEQITLYCKKKRKAGKKELIISEVGVSPDPSQYPIRDYRGKNLASVGYESLGGERLDAYGSGHLKIIANTSDGMMVDVHNEEEMKKYQIIDQNIPPKETLALVIEPGTTYAASQNYNEIILTVEPIV